MKGQQLMHNTHKWEFELNAAVSKLWCIAEYSLPYLTEPVSLLGELLEAV